MIGRTLSHYKVLEEISRGGMGIVYKALDLKLNREVALKVLPPELVSKHRKSVSEEDPETKTLTSPSPGTQEKRARSEPPTLNARFSQHPTPTSPHCDAPRL